MEALERQVEYYETEGGVRPFRDWLLGLRDKEGRRKIWTRIDRLILGNMGHCRPVGDGVMELKIDFGPGYRIYFGQLGNRLVILLCGGDKGTQAKDIRSAQQFWADYRRRHD